MKEEFEVGSKNVIGVNNLVAGKDLVKVKDPVGAEHQLAPTQESTQEVHQERSVFQVDAATPSVLKLQTTVDRLSTRNEKLGEEND